MRIRFSVANTLFVACDWRPALFVRAERTKPAVERRFKRERSEIRRPII